MTRDKTLCFGILSNQNLFFFDDVVIYSKP